MILDDTWFDNGDLLKCCAFTLLSLADNDPTADYGDGAVVQCKFSKDNSNHRLVLFNSRWRWLNPRDATAEQRDILRKSGGLYSQVLGRNRD